MNRLRIMSPLAGQILALAGAVCVLGSPVGSRMTSARLAQAHSLPPPRTLASRVQDPAFLAAIDHAAQPIIFGAALGLLGVALVALAIGGFGYRAPWLWWWLFVAAVLWLVFWSMPIGATVGILALVFLVRQRRTFFAHPTG